MVSLPSPWQSTNELIRRMRCTLATAYAHVLTQEQKEQANRWGWKEEEQRAVRDANAAHTTTASDASAAALTGAAFHRFAMPLASILRELRVSVTQVSRIVGYHCAMVSAVQAAVGATKTAPPGAAVHQLQPVARAYLMYLKQRLDLQRQQTKLAAAFHHVHSSIQQELQDRKRRSIAASHGPIVRGPNGHYVLPSSDLYALASSLAYIRSELKLTNGAEDPANPHTVQPVGTFTITNQHTIDGQELPIASVHDNVAAMSASKSVHISSSAFAFDKHNINFSSTGTITCFVLDVNLVRPIMQTPADHVALDALVDAALALPGGLSYLHRQSSLSQLLRHGFFIYGTLTIMTGNPAEGSLIEQPLDGEFIELLFASEFRGVFAKIALLVDHEGMAEANVDEQMYLKREAVVALFQSQAAIGGPASPPTDFFFSNFRRLVSRLEGPSLVFAAAGLPHAVVPFSARDGHTAAHASWNTQEEYAVTFVGVEPVERKKQENEMDTGAATSAFFAYRFLLSHPLVLPLSTAVQLFSSDFYFSAGAPPDLSALLSSPPSDKPVVDGSYHAVALDQSVNRLLNEDGEMKAHAQEVFGTRHSYTAAAGSNAAESTLRTQTIRLTSFLLRDLAALPGLLQSFTRLYCFQRAYRTCFDENVTTDRASSSSADIAAPSSVAPAAAAAKSTGKRLKFSYRDLLEDQPAPVDAPASTGSLAGSGSSDVRVRVVASAPNSLRLETSHSSTGPLAVTMQWSDDAASTPRVQVECHSKAASSAYALKILLATGSVPMMMHYTLMKSADIARK